MSDQLPYPLIQPEIILIFRVENILDETEKQVGTIAFKVTTRYGDFEMIYHADREKIGIRFNEETIKITD